MTRMVVSKGELNVPDVVLSMQLERTVYKPISELKVIQSDSDHRSAVAQRILTNSIKIEKKSLLQLCALIGDGNPQENQSKTLQILSS